MIKDNCRVSMPPRYLTSNPSPSRVLIDDKIPRASDVFVARPCKQERTLTPVTSPNREMMSAWMSERQEVSRFIVFLPGVAWSVCCGFLSRSLCSGELLLVFTSIGCCLNVTRSVNVTIKCQIRGCLFYRQCNLIRLLKILSLIKLPAD